MIHNNCNGTTIDDYNKLLVENRQLSVDRTAEIGWHCNKCLISSRSKIFQFGLESDHNLRNIMTCDRKQYVHLNGVDSEMKMNEIK